jgi:hypothetical protein
MARAQNGAPDCRRRGGTKVNQRLNSRGLRPMNQRIKPEMHAASLP